MDRPSGDRHSNYMGSPLEPDFCEQLLRNHLGMVLERAFSPSRGCYGNLRRMM